MSFRPAAVIPTHNHAEALPSVVAGLKAAGLPVFIVDDGSSEPAGSLIARLHAPDDQVFVHRFEINQGKGVAVVEGFRRAAALGFTHAVQVDADGQHDLSSLPRLLDAAQANTDALVSGKPIYDHSVPRARAIGRWVTHLWVFVETLSLRITDSMCGFRVYPLAETLAMLAEEQVGRRMDFDTDIMVRLFWRGVPPVMVPVWVTYPPGNTSNFDVFSDNLRISLMHTRLVITMLLRLPRVLRNRPRSLSAQAEIPDGEHWAGLAERGALWGLKVTAATYRLLGRKACMALLMPITLYFMLTGTRQREASRIFLSTIFDRPASVGEIFRHFLDFSQRALDTIAAWTGAIPPDRLMVDDPAGLESAAADPQGCLLVVSHHGNVEIARALIAQALKGRLTVLVHTRHAENFNRVLAEFRPEVQSRLIQVTEIGPETAIQLNERVAKGEWVAIAGDRIPVNSEGRVSLVDFLGVPAPFSQGPWILAHLQRCPVRLLFCTRENGHWRMALEPFTDRITLPRDQRDEAIGQLVGRYAARLEHHCRQAPMQWYNFFDFWGQGKER